MINLLLLLPAHLVLALEGRCTLTLHNSIFPISPDSVVKHSHVYFCRQQSTIDEDPCAMLEFAEDILPFECLGADRQKSKAFFDACNEMVEEQGWSFAQLQACGMMEAG